MKMFSRHISTAERWIFFALLFCVPFQVRLTIAHWTLSFNEWTSGFIWGTDILAALLLLSVVLRWFQERQRITIHKSDWILLALVVCAAVSITNAISYQVALYRLIKFGEYVLFYLYCSRNLGSIIPLQKAVLVVASSATMQSMIGIVQYALQHHIGLRYLGESPLDVHAHGVAVVAVGAARYLRIYGTTPHPNVLSVWLMLGLWGLLWLLSQKNLHRWRIQLLVSYGLVLFAFLLTFSRVSILAWLVSTGGMLLMCRKTVHRETMRAIVISSVLIGCMFVATFWTQVVARARISADDEAVTQRIFYARLAQEDIVQKPLFGIGIGQFVPKLKHDVPHFPSYIYQPAHNVYLLIGSELGIPGILLFLLWLALILSSARHHKVLMVGYCALLFIALFDHFFWTLQQGGLVFWLSTSLLRVDKKIIADRSQ